LYYPTVERLKLYVENLNMLIANYLFYSEENDRIISKLSVIRCQNTLNFSINTRTFTKKLIRFNLLFNFINPLRPQMVYETSLSCATTAAGLRSTGTN
jgi:hypothetical protein